MGRAGGAVRRAARRRRPDAEERLWLLRRSLRIASAACYRPAGRARSPSRSSPSVGRDEEADAALEQILTQTKAWADLAKLLHARADRAPDVAERVRLLFRIAQLEEERVADLGRGRRAPGATEIARRREPTNERALRALVARARGAPGLGGPGRGAAPRSRPRGRRRATSARSCCCASARSRRRASTTRSATFDTYREVLQANPHSAAAVAGLERLLAGRLRRPARRDRAPGAAVLRADRQRAPSWRRAHEALLAGGRHDAASRSSGSRSCARSTAARSTTPAGAYRASLALFEIDPADAKNRDALIGFAPRRRARPPSWPSGCARWRPRPTTRSCAATCWSPSPSCRSSASGARRDAEKVYAEILAVEPLHAGAFRALTRLYRDGAALGRAARAARRAPAGGARRRASGWTCWRRWPSSTRRCSTIADHALAVLREDAGARPGRPARPPRARSALRRARALARSRGAAGHARSASRPAAEVPELEFRRAELRASRLDDVDGALDLLEAIVKTAPSHEGARRLLEKLLALPEHRQRVAQHPRAALRGERRLGAPGRRSWRSQREALRGARGRGDAGAHRRPAGEQAAGARGGARDLAPGAGRRSRPTPDALPEIERLATALERFSELVDVYQELAFKRDAADIAGRADLLSRAAQAVRRAARQPARGHRRLEAGPRTSTPTNADDRRAGGGGARGALRRDRRRRGAGEDPAPCRSRWADAAAERKALLFRIAGLEEKSLGDTDGGGRRRCARSWRSTRRTARPSTPSSGSSRRARSTASASRCCASASTWPATPGSRQELWRRVASLLERDVGDVDEAIAACVSILDENPEDDQRARDAGAPLRPAGAAPRSPRTSSSAGWPWRAASAAPRARRRTLLRPDRARCSRGRSAIRPTRSSAGARCWRAAPGRRARRWRRWSASCSPSTDAGLRLAAAQALEPVYESGGRFAELAAVVRSTSRRRPTRARRLEQLIAPGGAAGDPPRRRRGGAAPPRRCAIRDALGRAGAGGAARRLRAAGRRRRASAEVAALYREISPDVLDEAVKLRLDRFDRRRRAAPGRPRRRPPSTTGACWIASPRTTRAGGAGGHLPRRRRRRGAVRDPGRGARSWPKRPGGRAAPARCSSARWPRSRSAASTRRSPPTSGCWSSRRATRAPLQALDRLYTKAERWARSRRASSTDARARRAARARGGRHPLPPGADRARRAGRSRGGARAPARGAGRRSRPPRRHRHAGGDARRHRRAGRGGRAARAGVRGARRLAVADQDRRDPPAAGRGARRARSPGRSASPASTRSSSRTTTAPCAGTARCSRRRRPSA